MVEVTATGIPPGLLGAVVTLLSASPQALRRRTILQELEQRGHRISLAGLNRVLDFGLRNGTFEQGPEGVRLKRSA
jgi:hypothetical protein